MSDSDASDLFPPFSVREVCIVDESAELAFMCNGKRFFVIVDAADLDDEKQILMLNLLDLFLLKEGKTRRTCRTITSQKPFIFSSWSTNTGRSHQLLFPAIRIRTPMRTDHQRS